jgi:hypothetical protein
MNRRNFLAASAAAPLPLAAQVHRRPGTHLKIGLNAYSFNRLLTSGTMKLPEVIDYCTAHNIDGVDLTGCYFPGYPAVTADDYLYALKRPWLNGVTLTGTGVRNDFATAARPQHIAEDWTDMRANSAPASSACSPAPKCQKATPSTRCSNGWSRRSASEPITAASAESLSACSTTTISSKTADETIRMVKAVNCGGFSVILDVGSLRQGDLYEEIARLNPSTCTWQIKQTVWYGTKETPIDLPRLRGLIEKAGYRSFLPVESWAPGHPTAFLEKVTKAML